MTNDNEQAKKMRREEIERELDELNEADSWVMDLDADYDEELDRRVMEEMENFVPTEAELEYERENQRLKDAMAELKKNEEPKEESRIMSPQNHPRYFLVDFFIESKHGVSKKTQVTIYRVCNKFLEDLENKHGVHVRKSKIDDIDGAKVQLLWNEMTKTLNVSTLNLYSIYLNQFFIWAYKISAMKEDLSGIITHQKVPKEESIPEEERVSNTYTKEQIKALFDCIEQSGSPTWLRDRAIVAVILYSGLRQEELCSLKIKSIQIHGHGKIYCLRKGGIWKDVAVSEQFYKYLNPYLESRGEYKPEDALFASVSHTNTDPCHHMRTPEVYLAIAAYQKEANLPTGTHILRHVFVSAVEKLGGAAVARDCANHKDIRTTNRYDHTTEEERKVAVDSLDYFGDRIAPALGGSTRQPFLSDLSGLTEEDRITLFDLASVLANGDSSTKQTLRTKINNLHSVFCDI